ncbi:tranport-associated late exocytosis protein [Ceratobasidium sp. AG-Ba]|nr:tranport-associated late exocytosis protein [Ceratobasidium sp. AG-Ba]
MSIDPNKATSSNNSSQTFGTAFVTNIALLGIQVGAFVVLKHKFDRIYSPRSTLPPPGKRATQLPSGPWRWLPAVIFAPSEDIIRKNGLDAYLFIRFLRLMIWIFGLFTLISWPVILPIDAANMPGENFKDGLAKLSWGNIINSEHQRYIAHVVLVYIMTFLVFWLIRRELLIFVHARHQFLISRYHSHLAQAKTVLITSMPDELCSEKALREFCAFVPGGINKVWIYRDQPELPDLFNDRLKACQKLEKAEVKYIRTIVKKWRAHLKEEKKKRKAIEKAGGDPESKPKPTRSSDEYPLTDIPPVRASLLNQPLPPTPRHSGTTPTDKNGQLVPNGLVASSGVENEAGPSSDCQQAMDMVPRPTHRLGWIPFFGEKVDTIDWCKNEIARLNVEVNEKRKGLAECKPHGSAFIQCNLQMGAHVLAQCVSYHEPLKMSHKWIEVAPDDIIWDNIDDGAYEVRARYVLSWLLTFAVIAFWFIPTAFAGILSNVDQLCVKASWLAWICRLPGVVQGIIQGVLPPVFLALLFILLPIYLRAMAVFECIPRHSLVSISLYKRYFLFLVVHGFLTVTVSSGLTSAIVPILREPSQAVTLLAQRLPNASIFFLTYIVANGLAGSAGALAQVGPLVVHFLKKHLFGSTPRQAFDITFLMPKADFGTILPRMSLLCTIALAYSIISPVINGLAMLAFALYYVAWKFLFLWVYDQPEAQETGGLYFPLVVSNLFVGLYIEQLCLAGLFFLDGGKTSSIILGVFMVILIIITITVQILYRKSFAPITDFLPMSMATKDLHDRQRRHQKKPEDPSEVVAEEMDLFRRDHLQRLIRRKVNKKLKLETKPKSDIEFAPPAPQPSTSIPQGEPSTTAPQLPSPKILTRTNTHESHGSKKSNKSNKSQTKQERKLSIAPAAPALKTSMKSDSDSEDDSDLDDFAFDHPSTYKDAPWIWIPKDKLGISDVLVKELHEAKVEASDEGAFMDEKGVVEVKRNPPDEAWSGGLDI